MRLRKTVAAAVGALALVLTLPASSASAATGQFRYTYVDEEGELQTTILIDPPSGECMTLPEVEDDGVPPAQAPKNHTDATAVVFLAANCEGDVFYSLRPGGGAGDRLKLRSVLFS